MFLYYIPQAGGLATETLRAIRTVTALNIQPQAIASYRAFVLKAMGISLVKVRPTNSEIKGNSY